MSNNRKRKLEQKGYTGQYNKTRYIRWVQCGGPALTKEEAEDWLNCPRYDCKFSTKKKYGENHCDTFNDCLSHVNCQNKDGWTSIEGYHDAKKKFDVLRKSQ